MTEKYRRVQFDFAPESIEELEGLQSVLGLKTKAHVIRYALQVLRWIVDQAKSGKSVLVEKNGHLQEVLFPFLSPVTPEPISQEKAPRSTDEGRDYARQKARELRERADELLERAREASKDSISAAMEAARKAYAESEKLKKQ